MQYACNVSIRIQSFSLNHRPNWRHFYRRYQRYQRNLTRRGELFHKTKQKTKLLFDLSAMHTK